jgi:choline dehydrogenase-like flavoprotein
VVGRYFMEHPHIVGARALVADPALLGFYDYNLRTAPRRGQGVVGCMHLCEQAQRTDGLLNYDASVTADNIGDSGYAALRRIWNSVERGQSPDDLMGDLKTALFDIDDTFAGLLGRFGVREYQPEVGSFRLWSFAEQAPNPDSRVVLDDERDALGVPRVRLDWRMTELDKRSLLATHGILAKEFGRTGIGRIQIEAWLQDESAGWSDELSGGYHPMGTTRMADDPRRGVVDRHCRVHGLGNLYVAGSSVFPTGGSANPTLTIVALALRLAEHLKTELSV